MGSNRPDAFNHALHTANIWLADVGEALGTRDRRYNHRVLRAWLHALRDRLTVDAAAKFGAQLPELVRGVYYEGWDPSRVPVTYGVPEYRQRFAMEAGIPLSEVPLTASTITDVLVNHMSPGQLMETFAELPTELRTVILGLNPTRTAQRPVAGTAAESPWSQAGSAASGGLITRDSMAPGRTASDRWAPGRAQAARMKPQVDPDRMARLENQVANLAEAVRALADAARDSYLTDLESAHLPRAAQFADEILTANDFGPLP